MNPNKKIKNSTDDEMPLAQMNSPNDANNNRSPLQNSPNDANNNRSPLLNSPPIPSQISPASSENRHQFQSQASDEQPFFASNLAYYPELPQPGTAKDMNKYLSYEDWKSTACGNLAVKKTKNLQQQQHQQQQKHLLKLQKQQPKQQHQKQQQKQLQKQQKLQQKQKHKEQKELKKLQKSKQSMQHEMANPIGAGHGLQNFNANPYPWQFMEEDNEFSSTSQLFGQPKQQQQEQPRQHEMANPFGAGYETQKFNANPIPWQVLGNNSYSSTSPQYGQPKQQQQEQPQQEHMLFNENQMMMTQQPFGQQKQQLSQEQTVAAIKANYQNQSLDGNSNIWPFFGDNICESTQQSYGQPKQKQVEEMTLNETHTSPPYGQQKQQMSQDQLNLDGYSNTWNFLNNNNTPQQAYGQPKQQLTQEQIAEAIKANYQNQSLDGNSNIWPFFGDNTCDSTQQSYGQPKPKQVEEMVNSINTNYQGQNLVNDSNIWQTLNENQATAPPSYGQQKQQMTQDQLNLDGSSNTWQFSNNKSSTHKSYRQRKKQLELAQEKTIASVRAKFMGQNSNGNSNIWHPLNASGYTSTKLPYGQPKLQQREQLAAGQMAESIKPNNQGQNVGDNPNIFQLLGEKVYASTMQPNGEPLAPLTMLIEMSGVNLACVLSTAHLIENHQDPKDYCMLTHFKDSELRSFVVLSDEVKHVLKRYEIREHNLDNTVPNLASPMADNLPQPPTQWMPNRKLMPKQKELLQNRQTVDARGHDKFINPNLRLVKEWQPRTDTYNYKLQSPSPSPSPSP